MPDEMRKIPQLVPSPSRGAFRNSQGVRVILDSLIVFHRSATSASLDDSARQPHQHRQKGMSMVISRYHRQVSLFGPIPTRTDYWGWLYRHHFPPVYVEFSPDSSPAAVRNLKMGIAEVLYCHTNPVTCPENESSDMDAGSRVT